MTTPMAEITADRKNPRLIAAMPLRSPARGATERMPTIAVSTPTAGISSGKISPFSPNAFTPRISAATSVTA